MLARQFSFSFLPFKVSHSITYLCIHVSNTFSKLFTEDFTRLLERVEQELKRWVSLPLSVLFLFITHFFVGWIALSPHLYGMAKPLGGMSLPNFQCYYWASNIDPILHWLYEDPGADSLSWVAVESTSCLSSSLAALVYAPLSFPCDKSPVHSNHVFSPSIIESLLHLGMLKALGKLMTCTMMGLSAHFSRCMSS